MRLFPPTSQEIGDLQSILQRQGIEIYEDPATTNAVRAAANATEGPEADPKEKLAAETALDVSLGAVPESPDLVSLYLREMGSVPLLTREGEVTIAKRIERGQRVVMGAITRSPIVIKELIVVGEDLRKGRRSIKEVVQFDDAELTEDKIANKTRKTLRYIEKIAKLYDTALKQAAKLKKTPKAEKRAYVCAKWDLARTRIEISRAIRDIAFNPFEKKRLIDKIRRTVERLQSLEREAR